MASELLETNQLPRIIEMPVEIQVLCFSLPSTSTIY